MGEIVLNWRQVFAGLDPTEILSRVGGKWDKTPTGLKIIGRDYTLVNRFLLPLETPIGCWPGGDAVDTAALACNGDYNRALHWLVSTFPEYSSRYAGLDHNLLASEIARQAEQERSLLTLSLSHLTKSYKSCEHSSCTYFLTKHNQTFEKDASLLYFPAEIKYLRTLNIPTELPDLPGAKKEVIVCPIFNDWWTVAGWLLIIPETGEQAYWPFTPSADGGAGGLWRHRPGSNSQVILTGWPKNKITNSDSFNYKRLIIKLTRAPEKRHWGINGFIIDPKSELHQIHWAGDLFNSFKIYDKNKELNRDQYAADIIAVSLAKELRLSTEVKEQVEKIVISPALRIMVSEYLKKYGLVHLAALLNEQPSTKTWKFGNAELLERNSELYIKTEHGDKCLANFRVEFNYILAFPERPQEPYWSVTAWVAGYSVPIIISPVAAKKSTDLIACINAALNQHQQPQEAKLLDQVSGKMVMKVIMDKSTRAKKKFGLAQLGLSYDRTVYRFPGLQVSQLGELEEEYLPHPEMPLLSYFDKLPGVARCVPADTRYVDDDLRKWLCRMAGAVIRSQLHLTVAPIFLQDSTAARQKCSALFSIFGQKEPILFNKAQSIGPELNKTFNGYPCWGITGIECLPTIDNPIIALSENQGESVIANSHNTLNSGLPLLRNIWVEFIKALMGFNFKEHTLNLNESIETLGEQFLIKYCPSAIIWGSAESKYPGLSRLLMDIPVENIGQIFNTVGDQVVMHPVSWVTPRNKIIEELKSHNINATPDANLTIKINKDQLIGVLKEFYHANDVVI